MEALNHLVENASNFLWNVILIVLLCGDVYKRQIWSRQ